MSALTVTVLLDDLTAVLRAVDYRTDRSLVGPVDRMGDAVALVRMRAALAAPSQPEALVWCSKHDGPIGGCPTTRCEREGYAVPHPAPSQPVYGWEAATIGPNTALSDNFIMQTFDSEPEQENQP